MSSHLLEFLVSARRQPGQGVSRVGWGGEGKENEGNKKYAGVSVIISRPAKIPSFFPSHLLQGQRVRCEILIIYFKDGCNSEIKKTP